MSEPADGPNNAVDTEQKNVRDQLKRLEWMLSGKPLPDSDARPETYGQDYGDLTALNRDGLILKSIGRERLARFANDYLELLGTSSAIYEANGDYALGIFSSGWCRMLDCASRRLCDTPDNAEALGSGQWLCHESCWTECCKRAIAEGAPVDVACHGGLRISAVPILANGKAVGAINFGYGDPPKDPETLQKVAKAYQLDNGDLVRAAGAYDSRPPFIIELAKKRLHATAGLIGSMIETKLAQEALCERESFINAVMEHLPIGIAVNSVDPGVEFSYMNGEFPKIYRTTKEALARPDAFWDVVYEDPGFREKIKNKVVEDVNSGDPHRMNWEDVPFTRNGQGPFYICARNIPLEDKSMMISTVWDVTDRKQTEEALRRSEETLRTTLNSIGDAVVSTGIDGCVASMNPVAESLTGWTQQEAAGQPLETVFRIINEQTRQPVASPVTTVLKSGLIVGLANHALLIARDGREIPIADSGAPIRNDAGEITGVVLVFRDQTSERAAREALEESEARFRGIYNTIATGVARVSLDFHIQAANQAYCTMLGYTEQELIGKHFKEISDPEIIEDNLKKQHQLAKGHIDHYRMEKTFIHKDGSKRYGLLDANLIRDAQGKPAYFLGSVVDITERKQAEEKLEIQYRLLKIAGDTAAFGGWDVELKTNISTWSDAVADIHEVPHGYAPPVEEGINFYAPEWRAKITEVFSACAEKGIPYDEEMEIITSKGKRVWVRTIGRAMKDPKGSIIKVQGSFQDITEYKRQEDNLCQSEERHRLLADNTLDVIWVMSMDARFTYVNPAVRAMFGFAPDEWIGTGLWEHCDERHFAWMKTLIEQETAKGPDQPGVIFETQMLRRDGSVIAVEIHGQVIFDDRNRPVSLQGVTRDITDRKRAEAERDKMQAQLLQSQKMESVGRLAGGVAHDFNNMLGVIIGNAELALDRMPPDDPLHADLQEILDAAGRSTDITRQLLAFARKQTIAPRALNLNDTVEGMLKMLRRLIGEDINLTWQPGPGPMPVFMDPSQLDQILANLLVNARDSIGGVGKVTIETAGVRFDTEYCADHAGFMPGEFIMLAVSDDGCGMDRKTLDTIFEPFFTTKGVGKGTGLGLSTVFGIVRQNDGFINVYSEPDRGTTFRIYLARHEEEAGKVADRDVTEIPAGRGETVLILEDEASILKLATRMLEKQGYTVLAAAAPGEAEALAKEHAGGIQLLITDVVMPEMNGRDLAQSLKTHYPALKVLFMSGYTANVIAHHGVLDKGVNFIQKPFSSRELSLKVRKALGGE